MFFGKAQAWIRIGIFFFKSENQRKKTRVLKYETSKHFQKGL